MHAILIIEDEPEIRELLAYNISKKGWQPLQAENANEGLILLEQHPVELVLLDLMLPGLKGVDFLRILRSQEEHNLIRVMVLSALSEEERIVEALKIGADDYVTKPFSIEVLLARMGSLLSRGRGKAEHLLSLGKLRLDLKNHSLEVEGKPIKLTLKEFELLTRFMQQPGQALKRDDLLDQIWDYDAEVQTRTLDAHIASLRRKLGREGQRIQSRPKVGYGLDLN